jgi:hypothetical protein
MRVTGGCLSQVTLSQINESGLGSLSRSITAALSLFICELLTNLTSKTHSTPFGSDQTAQIEAACRMLLTESGVQRLFSMAASGTGTVASSVLSVVLNLLSEKEMVLGMRVSGQPMRLSAVFMQLKENSLLKVRDSHCS